LILWFVTSYTIIIIVHETAHAVVAYAFGLNPTLYQFWVDFDFDRATLSQRALVGVAGPAVSLIVGLIAWFLYKRAKDSRAGLPLCYLTAGGISNFCGNLMSAAFVGDFSNVAGWLGLPSPARYGISIAGAVTLSVVLFLAGRELGSWTPLRVGRFARGLFGVALPVISATAIIVLINQPVSIPISFGAARSGESLFWLFALVGILTVPKQPAGDETRLRLHRSDGIVAMAVFLIVRLMVRGIAFPS
jgi:hypothetical protein